MRTKLFGLAGLSVLLAGCATTVPTYPATLAFERADCATVPETVTAVSLTPDKDKKIWMLDSQLSASGPCLDRNGVSAPYMVFSLPEEGKAKMVELGAGLELARVLSPRVVLLDAQGAETRSFSREQYMFRPGLLSVQFVPQANERYALVTVDPEPIGQSHDTIVAGTSTATIYTGFGASNWRSGHEAMMSRGFSYEGMVRALVYRADDAR
ncbi:hypothetical protein P8Q88_02900 [Qipengyuania sp. XHP0207]|uniref:hypothetical protein n=1 Tax=Qipengyuania sp. XHP0207 TaxID=3038078 RepID=UPI00241F7C61|nr:hypothetical protein [Qipengyuania sp. XHP0207]MDG5747117.1 hypothetical protein [Qipengyuania sp. XHP0207]